MRFKAQAGNLLNRVDFCPPVLNWSTGSINVQGLQAGGFGSTDSQCNIPRRIQFGLTMSF